MMRKSPNKDSDLEDNTSGTPDSELDSGISINGHYEDVRNGGKNHRLDYERIDEIKTMTGTKRLEARRWNISSIIIFLMMD
jgi:hypothetical protein